MQNSIAHGLGNRQMASENFLTELGIVTLGKGCRSKILSNFDFAGIPRFVNLTEIWHF